MKIRRFTPDGPVKHDSELPLVFIHINKTAGTTFSHMLFDLFSPEQIAPAYRGDFSALDVGRPQHRLYHGHMRYADWYHNGVPALPICMLRDPEARVVSQYKSFKNAANAKDAQRWLNGARGAKALEIARSSTFDEFLLSDFPPIRGHIDNIQVQFLSEGGAARNEDDVQTALRNITDALFFFGITDRYDDAMNLLSWQLADRVLPSSPSRNISKPETIEAVSPEAKAALERYTKWDKLLYTKANALFEERLRQVADGIV
ncbi:Sulfotransferase family protein [Jannaschia faecimaris]|uniref:Sulfotransferase family protein n=1 Tax=Jannaschia faecimaris TaxID=1244108 RepID=A0A1H3K8E6_9RHOB|nr:sulfotransferase family 2 domain-containing protein [Jannaschia faecimaris]SDY48169.1 Sulfotransferase family protein [Jannaschia faecimaris]